MCWLGAVQQAKAVWEQSGSGGTCASQLGARKKGVEKRSFVLTTLCSVDLKRPFVHLPHGAACAEAPDIVMRGC